MKNGITDFDGRKPICILTPPFKGQRNYLHGPDIAQELVKVTGTARNVRIQFHRLCKRPLKIFSGDPDDVATLRAAGELCSVMTFEQGDDQRCKLIVAIEDMAHSIDRRRPYDETAVAKEAKLIGKHIEQTVPSAGNFFERVVALNKLLLNSIVEDHPWIFSEIKLNYAPPEPRKVSLSLTRTVGVHSYKSTISGDDVMLGTILFTRQPE